MPEPQTATGIPDGWEVVQATPAAPARPPSPGRDFKILGVNIHVPPEEQPRADSNIVGWGSEGAGVAPEDALAGGMALKSLSHAMQAGGALAGLKNAVAQASPIIKYEATKALLEHLGLPSSVAIPAAMAVSGYKRGGAAAAEGEAAAATKATPAAPAPVAEAAPAAVTPPPAPYEQAIADSRAAVANGYRGPAPEAPAAAPVSPAPAPRAAGGPPRPAPNPVIQKIVDALKTEGGLSESEAEQTYRWIAQGVDPKTVWKRIQDARALQKTGPFAGLPSSADVERAITDRNVRGRWPEE